MATLPELLGAQTKHGLRTISHEYPRKILLWGFIFQHQTKEVFVCVLLSLIVFSTTALVGLHLSASGDFLFVVCGSDYLIWVLLGGGLTLPPSYWELGRLESVWVRVCELKLSVYGL